MTDSLYSLAYFSCNAIEGDDETIQAEVNRILEVAREKNAALNITGALLFTQGYFAQILEGDRDELEELFEVIGEDDRHSDVVVIHYHKIDERSFGYWSMKYAHDPDLLTRENDAPVASEPGFGTHFLSVLRDYIARNEAI